MALKFEVVRCASCGMSRVKQVTKLKKFQCVVCGEKQSIQRALYSGTAQECRHYVQQLNMTLPQKSSTCSNVDLETRPLTNELQSLVTATHQEAIQPPKDNTSKWDKFLDGNELLQDEELNQAESMGSEDVVILSAKKPRHDKPSKMNSSNLVSADYSSGAPPPKVHKKDRVEPLWGNMAKQCRPPLLGTSSSTLGSPEILHKMPTISTSIGIIPKYLSQHMLEAVNSETKVLNNDKLVHCVANACDGLNSAMGKSGMNVERCSGSSNVKSSGKPVSIGNSSDCVKSSAKVNDSTKSEAVLMGGLQPGDDLEDLLAVDW